MSKKTLGIIVLVFVLLIIGGGIRKWKLKHSGIPGGALPIVPASSLLKNYKLLHGDSAGHSSWSPTDPNLLVIDKAVRSPYYQLYYLNLKGEILSSLTSGHAGITQRNNGWPEWDPKNEYIVFQSEEPEHFQDNLPWLAFPGLGFYSNLWATDLKGEKFWKLTNLKFTNTNVLQPVKGMVNAMFSHDGSKLYWTERYAGGGYLNWGKWQIKQADFVRGAEGPSLANEKIIIRAEDVCAKCNYIVNMGIFADGKTLVVAGNLDGQHVYGMDQYLLNLTTKKFTNLTKTPENWEEGSCLSPDGKKIVYSTDVDSKYPLDFDNADWSHQPKEKEYYIINTDGSGKQRLTFFNKEGGPEYTGQRVITAECSFSPDGKIFTGIVGFDKSKDATKSDIGIGIGLFELK